MTIWETTDHLRNAGTSTLPETNMAMENGPVEDVFPIENGDFPLPC